MPRATARLIEQKPGPADNVGLWLDKLIHRRPGTWTLEKDDRTQALARVCGKHRSEVGATSLLRLQASMESAHLGGDSITLEGDVNGRLLVDYGRATAAEASVSFHPIWGVPRIPGSALKGITRVHMQAEGESGADIEALFGPEPERNDDEEAGRGRIIFYDALPVDGKFELALDVLTPHHRSYYDGNGPPGEWEDPIPFTFITVVKTKFAFHLEVLLHGQEDALMPRSHAILERVRDALKNALEEAGVGAKTGAGYGRFSFKK